MINVRKTLDADGHTHTRTDTHTDGHTDITAYRVASTFVGATKNECEFSIGKSEELSARCPHSYWNTLLATAARGAACRIPISVLFLVTTCFSGAFISKLFTWSFVHVNAI